MLRQDYSFQRPALAEQVANTFLSNPLLDKSVLVKEVSACQHAHDKSFYIGLRYSLLRTLCSAYATQNAQLFRQCSDLLLTHVPAIKGSFNETAHAIWDITIALANNHVLKARHIAGQVVERHHPGLVSTAQIVALLIKGEPDRAAELALTWKNALTAGGELASGDISARPVITRWCEAVQALCSRDARALAISLRSLDLIHHASFETNLANHPTRTRKEDIAIQYMDSLSLPIRHIAHDLISDAAPPLLTTRYTDCTWLKEAAEKTAGNTPA